MTAATCTASIKRRHFVLCLNMAGGTRAVDLSTINEESSVTAETLGKFRKLIRQCINSQHYNGALFWADKVVSMSNGECSDIFWLARCMFLTKQYHRAAHLMKRKHLLNVHPGFQYLAAKCHFETKEYPEALEVLDTECKPSASGAACVLDTSEIFPSSCAESALKLLKGKIYEAMENRVLAAECFRAALVADVCCVEAYDSLVKHQMLCAQEEKDLLASLPFQEQCTTEEANLIKFLYENKLKKYNEPGDVATLETSPQECFSENMDNMVCIAERHCYNCNYQECHNITSSVLDTDPYHSECLPIHIACLVELKKSNDLFYLAHKLVDLYPDNAISWFAVGCYYLLIGKNDPARRYFSKATTLDKVFGPAWLAYGHSFAMENEHDQAMAAYFKASKLMKGCHLPLLYIGLEYGLTNNARLAERFFGQALTIAPRDPFVLHEMGVIAFQNLDYPTAERFFKETLERVEAAHHTVLSEKWEPLLNNLGHTCRKLKKHDEALEYHRQALVLQPQNSYTFAAIGYVHSLTKNYAEAVNFFHKALGIRRDDAFSTTMLASVIEQMMSNMFPAGDADEIPPFERVDATRNDDTSSMALDVEMEIMD